MVMGRLAVRVLRLKGTSTSPMWMRAWFVRAMAFHVILAGSKLGHKKALATTDRVMSGCNYRFSTSKGFVFESLGLIFRRQRGKR